MIARSRRVAALAFALSVLLSRAVVAQPAPASEAARTEARERFDRGLKLFNEGDNAGALAEFKRTNELLPNSLVLYNIGLVYAAMGRPVEALEALDKVLTEPGPLSPDRLARAKQTRDEQAARIASLDIRTSAPATIEVDSTAVGRTPLRTPLRVGSGVHVVRAAASGFAPAQREVTVAAGEAARVDLELVPLESHVGHVTVTTHLPGASLLVDDRVVGQTPLTGSISLPPGPRKIELRRQGYRAAQTEITLGEGATASVTLEPEIAPAALASDGGELALALSEPQAIVRVDGRSQGVYLAALALPFGPHHVEVERGGFEPAAADVTVDRGRTTTLTFRLAPTASTRAAYVSRTTSQRTWGIVALAGGAVLAGASVGLLVWNAGEKSDAHAALDVAEGNVARRTGNCNTSGAGQTPAACNAAVDDAASRIDNAKTRDALGYVGVGVFSAIALFGGYLLWSNDDPHRYDRTAWRIRPTRNGLEGVF